jgi:hypothetical protein
MGELDWDIDARAFARWRDLDATGIDLGDAGSPPPRSRTFG